MTTQERNKSILAQIEEIGIAYDYEADLRGANFCEADLRGANFRGREQMKKTECKRRLAVAYRYVLGCDYLGETK